MDSQTSEHAPILPLAPATGAPLPADATAVAAATEADEAPGTAEEVPTKPDLYSK